MKLSDHVKALASALEDLGDFEVLDGIEERIKTETAALDALRVERLAEEERLRAFNHQAEADKAKIIQDIEKIRNDRAVELEHRTKVIKAGEMEVTKIRNEVAMARKEHEAILAGLDVLRKRIG